MNTAQVLDHFERLCDAPDAIPRLRRFVLDLAIRGKLVDQEPTDEPPASESLRRIQARSYTAVSKSKRDLNADRPIDDDEIPFPVSPNSTFARLATIAKIEKGSTGIQKAKPGKYPLITLAEDRGTSEDFQFDAAAAIVPLISSTGHGHASLKRMHYQEGKFALGNILCAVIPFAPELVAARFLYEYLWAYKEPLLVEKMIGTANVSLTIGKIGEAPVPIVSPRSQERLQELMVLCDRLEAAQAERESRRDRLAAASLHRLNNGADADEFREHARFHLRHLPRLTARPEHIQQLRQTVLNLAVCGKLVPQDSNAEAAPSFGIESVEKEDRIQLRLPPGWSWARVEDVAEARLGKMLDKAKNSGQQFRYLRNTNVHWFDIRMEELKELRIEKTEVGKYLLLDGDVLICEGGHGIGRTAVWRGTDPDIVFQKALHRVRPGPALKSDFIAYCVCVYYDAGVLQHYFTGVGIPHFTGKALSELVFPLPPIAEQHRIVAKVEELMALCDRLEKHFTSSETESRRLLEAVLHQALNGGA